MKSSQNKRHAVSEEEQMKRYVYLLESLPRTVVEHAHAAAFAELSPAQRQEVSDVVGPLVSDAPGVSATSDSEVLAGLVRDPEPRAALLHADISRTVASLFVTSAAVVEYFTVGVGSVMIDERPPWVQELAGHDSAPIDAGTINHRRGVDSGMWFA